MEVKRNIEPKNNFLKKYKILQRKKTLFSFLMNVAQVSEKLLAEFIKNIN